MLRELVHQLQRGEHALPPEPVQRHDGHHLEAAGARLRPDALELGALLHS
jgi:hypothetical protein